MARLLQNVRLTANLMPPAGRKRYLVFSLVTAPSFDHFIMLHIVLNTASMAMQKYDQSSGMINAIAIGNVYFLAIFSIEAALKLVGLGPIQYVLHSL